jgi:hypothetical protein
VPPSPSAGSTDSGRSGDPKLTGFQFWSTTTSTALANLAGLGFDGLLSPSRLTALAISPPASDDARSSVVFLRSRSKNA